MRNKGDELMSEIIECSICGEQMEEERSNDAWPVNEGRCCGKCNAEVVIPARLELMNMRLEEGASPGH